MLSLAFGSCSRSCCSVPVLLPDWGAAAYHGMFHAVSAFNNAGFALYPDNLVRFNADPFVMVPICLAIVLGGLGFPVYLEVVEACAGTSPSGRCTCA